MHLRTIDDLGDLHGTRVLTRVDVNVPIHAHRVQDDTKVRLAVPTIIRLRDAGARVILASHCKEGARTDTLAPVIPVLRRALGGRAPVLLRDRVGTPALRRRLERMRNGDVVLLENLRSYPGEVQNAVPFARALASLAAVVVNDAFAVCHRAHASVATLPTLLPSAAGLLLEREVDVLSTLLLHPTHPFVALMGGLKVATKAPVIERLLRIADRVCIGGALAHAFLRARGYGIGASSVDRSGIVIAARLLRSSRRRRLLFPLDVTVAHGDRFHVVPIPRRATVLCGRGERIVDIGPETIRAYAAVIREAATIVWNGPLGVTEEPRASHGSVALARMIAARSSGRAFGVVGGGETLEVLARTGMARYIDHVSSGGGAMLAFLAGEELPGLVALRANT